MYHMSHWLQEQYGCTYKSAAQHWLRLRLRLRLTKLTDYGRARN